MPLEAELGGPEVALVLKEGSKIEFQTGKIGASLSGYLLSK
jgi:hypothetical protein